MSKSGKAVFGAVVFGIVSLFAVSWLLVQITRVLRPAAVEGVRFYDILTVTSDGRLSIVLSSQLIIDAVVAFVLAMLVHELVHGLTFWWLAGQRPTFGIKGLGIYVAAPLDVFVPRNLYLIVGMAPLAVLTLLGLLLAAIVPIELLPVLIIFISFNAAGAAGDLLMAVWLLSYSSHTLMQERGACMIVYGPEEEQRAA